ncbi:hypothetical protein GAR96_11280 [Salmonella enterica]|nr:hypothetical protein [Salmonella enterica subsp. enterica serovar Pomona]EAM8422741.1 hypothetical protein [Salmonella enterica]ECH8207435.1 hypothetical protein [Salmonella enterica subsp. enterica]EGI5344582.1 hypothetical protein [Salmonella enterica subsp. enterica serovar Sandiego]EAX7073305.1 hypothetical protein [Salmonella enterica]
MHSKKMPVAKNYKMYSSLITEEDKEKLDSVLDTIDFVGSLCCFASEAGFYEGSLPSKQISNFLSLIHNEIDGVISRFYSPEGGVLHRCDVKDAFLDHT